MNWFYATKDDQQIGPVDDTAIPALIKEGTITPATCVWSDGMPDWVPASQTSLAIRFPKNPPPLNKATFKQGSIHTDVPRRYMTEVMKKCPYCSEEVLTTARKCKHCQSPLLLNSDVIKKMDLGIMILLFVVTLGIYGFYLIPDFGRSVNVAIGRRKYSFALILVLGIITLGIAFSVCEIMYAYDLERNGSKPGFEKRAEFLCPKVLILNILALVVAFASGGFAFIVSCFLGTWATWLIQKELNFLAERQVKTMT